MDYAIAALALYAGILGLIAVWLTSNVAGKKQSAKILFGDGGDPDVIRAMRGQANFVETVPLTLILLMMMVFLGAPAWLIHILGMALLVGRVLHAHFFIKIGSPGWQRRYGFLLTAVAMVGGALGSIILSLIGMIS